MVKGQCLKSCHDAEEGLPLKEDHGARWVDPAGMWGLASKMEEISRKPAYLKTECSPACVVVSSI